MSYHSYEDMARANAAPPAADVLEAFSGPAVVRWYNTIKYKLGELIKKQEANRNEEYAKLLKSYLELWNANPITGSLNVETFQILKDGKVTPEEERGIETGEGGKHPNGAEALATMDWDQASYFQGLATSLDELIADAEAVGPGDESEQNMPMAGGAGSSMPPIGGDFGPQEEKPPGEGEPAPGEQPLPGEPPPGETPEPGAPGEEPEPELP